MSGLTWSDLTDGVGEVRGPDGRTLARYSWQRANHPYFDALRPLGHDGVLTTHAPNDHRWHHGLWWSWKFLNDVLFWEDHPEYGGNRVGLGRSVVTAHEVFEDDDTLVVQETLEWRVDTTGDVLLVEGRTIRLSVDPLIDGAWNQDWDQQWTAVVPVRFEATPWPETPWGGYGGLNYRPARAMVTDETIIGAGAQGVEALHGLRTPWAACTGVVDGAENDEPAHPAHGGVALLQHPNNPRYPDPVYAFSASTGFGFLATAPLMRESFALEESEILRIRNRVLVLGGPADAAKLAAAHASFAASTEDAPSSA
ncbi:MAG: DUF6807 family protein [Janthinobacterium lividum]